MQALAIARIEAYVGSSGLGWPHRGIRDPGPEESVQVGRDVGMWYFGWEMIEKQSNVKTGARVALLKVRTLILDFFFEVCTQHLVRGISKGTSAADTGGLMLSPPFLQLPFICLG